MKKLVTAIAVVGLMGVVAAGCGGDDSSSSGTTTTKSEDTTTTTASGGGLGASALASVLSKDCQFLLTGTYLNPLAAATSGKGDDIKNAASYLDEVAANAPAEIKDDMKTVADAVGKVSEALKGVDVTNTSAVVQAIQSLQGTFTSPDFARASQNVSNWITSNCGPKK